MRKYSFLPALAAIAIAMASSSCQDTWKEHYSPQEFTADNQVEIYQGGLAEYMGSQPALSTQHRLFSQNGIYDRMKDGQQYLVIVYDNSLLDASPYSDNADYANYCISDFGIAPAAMQDGMGIDTWYGKNLWISKENGQPRINGHAIARHIHTDNAYVYEIDGSLLSIAPSIYELIEGLDDAEYSKFKSLVKLYERTYFDPDKCTPAGTNEQGNTVYSDSVKGWTVKNILMDRYTEDGQDLWNMRSEAYNSTLLIPSNKVISQAVDTALRRVPRWLGRAATVADREKFEQWVVRACFIDRRLEPEEITGLEDIDCVGGYTKDTLEGTKFSAADMAMWRPTVQQVRTVDMITASNGNAYFIDWMKVPNNVVIYRLKSRFYQLWDEMSNEQKEKYFRWSHWINPSIVRDAQGVDAYFTNNPDSPLKPVYYHVLTAIPDDDARKAKLYDTDPVVCSVTYDGTLFIENNPRGQRIKECCIPAGEYYLRMGFKHSIQYSLSIQFNDTVLVKDMLMCAQGSNFHFDRGGVTDVDSYGDSSVGYPEGYNWHDWEKVNNKAQAYDTDGYQVGIVNVSEEGNFTITVSSSDMYYVYDYNVTDRSSSNIRQLMMYHWCLRPTKNNY